RRSGTPQLLALTGNGGLHSFGQHPVAAVMLAHLHELPVAIHAWLDGRDTPPQSALAFMQELVEGLGIRGSGLVEGLGARGSGFGGGGVRAPNPDPRAPVVSTVVGRYYAMDRDKRWEPTESRYDA